MDAVDRPKRGDRLSRAVALLALVVGLLAMHGVAGAHHAAAAGTETHGTTHATAAHVTSAHATSAHATAAHATTGHAAVPTEHGTDHTTHAYDEGRVDHAVAAAGVTATLPLVLPAAGVPGCDDDCEPGVATLCVAVLAVTALAVAAGLVARSRTSTSQATRRSRARAPVVLRLPPRLDPVAELCVSRT